MGKKVLLHKFPFPFRRDMQNFKKTVNRFTGFTESYNKTVIDCLSKPLIRVWLTGECFYHCILGISFNKFLQSAGKDEIF